MYYQSWNYYLYGKMYLAMHLLDIKTSKTIFGHDTLVPRVTLPVVAELHVASSIHAPVANVCDLFLFLDENRVIPDFRQF